MNGEEWGDEKRREERTRMKGAINRRDRTQVYTRQAATTAWQRDIEQNFSQSRLARLPRSTFTPRKLQLQHGSAI